MLGRTAVIIATSISMTISLDLGSCYFPGSTYVKRSQRRRQYKRGAASISSKSSVGQARHSLLRDFDPLRSSLTTRRVLVIAPSRLSDWVECAENFGWTTSFDAIKMKDAYSDGMAWDAVGIMMRMIAVVMITMILTEISPL
jgi:hypothetical protein